MRRVIAAFGIASIVCSGCGGEKPATQDVPKQKVLSAEEAAAVRASFSQKAHEEAAKAFPAKRSAFDTRVTAIELLVKRRKWNDAEAGLQSLHTELDPVLRSSIRSSPEVRSLKARYDAAAKAIAAAKAAPQRSPILSASVNFTGTQFEVSNVGDADWSDVKLDVNGGVFSSGFIYRTNGLRKGRKLTVGALQFANSDGVRFNPLQFKPQKMMVTALVDGQRAATTVRWQD